MEMTALWILPLALFAGASARRIIGGEPANIEDYPSIVQVDTQNPFTGTWNQYCAGNILTTRYVLSAAHCFEGMFYDPKYRRVRAGSAVRNESGVIAYVDDALNHPTYRVHSRYDGDITLVRLSSALVYTPFVQRTSIPIQDSFIPDNLPVVVAGWGATEETSDDHSPILRHVHVFTVNHALCAERYAALTGRPPITPNMICAGILDVGERDACQGDSGGPLYYGDITIGIVSWGQGCANATFPGVYTNIASYTNWVVANAI